MSVFFLDLFFRPSSTSEIGTDDENNLLRNQVKALEEAKTLCKYPSYVPKNEYVYIYKYDNRTEPLLF